MFRYRTEQLIFCFFLFVIGNLVTAGEIPPNSICFEAGSPPFNMEFCRNLEESDNASLFARFVLPWEEVEQVEGEYDYKVFNDALKKIESSGISPILCFTGTNGLYSSNEGYPVASDEEYINAWLKFVENTVKIYDNRVRIFEVWDFPDQQWQEISQYAYLLKRTSTLVKSQNSDNMILEGGLSESNVQWQKSLFGYDITPYIDGIVVHSGSNIDEFRNLMNEHDITDALVLSVRERLSAEEALKKWLVGLDKMVTVASFPVVKNTGLLQRASELINSELSPVPSATDSSYFSDIMTEKKIENIWHLQFFDMENDRYITAYFPTVSLSGEVDFNLNTTNTANPFVKDIVKEDMSIISFYLPDYDKGKTTITVPVKDYPLFFVYKEKVPLDFDVETEELQISDKWIMPVGEIIARAQQFQTREDEKLNHYTADGRIEMHFKLAELNNTVDLSTLNNFFFDDETGMEWEQKEIYLNGIRWKKKKLPEFPLIQPEKVVEVPLDIHLNKNYRYKLQGMDKVNGYECYKISFEPDSDDKSLYKGVVWIDSKTYARIKIYSVQTNLEKPIISNAQTNFFAPVISEDGNTYWLMDKIEGQQIFSTGGRNTVLNREVFFTNFKINADTFSREKENAYQSDNQMLRDTDKGFRYLVKENGKRVVKEGETKSALLGVGGVFYDRSLDYPIPLAGFNYFNFDFKDSGTQINLFFAGVLATLNVTDADFLGSNFELGADAFAIAIPLIDRSYDSLGNEVESENVDYLPLSLTVNLGLPVANYGKLRLSYDMEYKKFKTNDDTDPLFVLPQNHFTNTVKLRARYDRKGYSAEIWGSYSKRSKWDNWGLPGSGVFDESHRNYEGYGITVGKEFFLPYFQKAGITIEGMKGNHLDRFSKYSFNYFGNRVRGFSGSGIRFDEGMVAKTYYGFNLADVVRFDIFADYAKTRDSDISTDYMDHVGVGIGGNFIGPWNTIINIDYGYGLYSDIDNAEGESEFRFVMLKVF